MLLVITDTIMTLYLLTLNKGFKILLINFFYFLAVF